MIVKYQWVLSGTFTLNFFLAVDLWKVFIKIKLNQYSIPFFDIWSHILEVPGTSKMWDQVPKSEIEY